MDEDGISPEELTARPHRAAGPLARKVLAVVGLAAVFFGVLVVRNWRADSDTTPVESTSEVRVMPTSAAIEDQYGLRLLGVDVTSAGGMIQVRYQVLDSAKTEAIHSKEGTLMVIDGSGTKYDLPGMAGHSHVGSAKKAGSTDFVLLANARGGVKSGSTVTLKIGDLELRNVPVS